VKSNERPRSIKYWRSNPGGVGGVAHAVVSKTYRRLDALQFACGAEVRMRERLARELGTFCGQPLTPPCKQCLRRVIWQGDV
jgi:hypothetical protein